MKQDLIQTYDMLPSGGTVLCAVSGGADSMCLLAWLLELGPKYGCAVAAAHYNHGLRGAQGDADEAFVRDWCAGHSVPFYAGRGDVASAAKEHGWSIEEAGRNLRYAFLSETAEQIGALRVATAHNRGDNAETVLFNLARGSAARGAAGIPPVRGPYVRPLLWAQRADVLRHGAGPVHDEHVFFLERLVGGQGLWDDQRHKAALLSEPARGAGRCRSGGTASIVRHGGGIRQAPCVHNNKV